MKKKTSIIVSVIIAIILLILLIIGITYKKPDDAILKSEKSYLAMLVRNENIQNSKKIDNVLNRIKTKTPRYQKLEKAYKNYYKDYINTTREIKEAISKAQEGKYINLEKLSQGEAKQKEIKAEIKEDIKKIDPLMEKYKTLNKKDEMIKYGINQGIEEQDKDMFYKLIGGDSEVKSDDITIRRLALTKDNYKLQENIVDFLIEQNGNWQYDASKKEMKFNNEERENNYKNLITLLSYNVNEFTVSNKAVLQLLDTLKSNTNKITNTIEEQAKIESKIENKVK